MLHDLQLAASVGDSLILLQSGRLAAQGPPDAVLTSAHLAEIFGVGLIFGRLPPNPWMLAAKKTEIAD